MQKVNFKYEILVGDDASTDGTGNIIREYQQKYPEIIKAYLHKENIGPTKNAYQLFLLAKGDYLATCEGDDYWIKKDKLQRQVSFLEENKNYIGCSHCTLNVNQNGEPLKKQRIRWIAKGNIISLKNFKGYFLPGQASTLVRKNLYKDCSEQDYSFFYKAHRCIGDRTTALLYLSKGNFYRFDEKMSCYRVNELGKSVTSKVYKNNQNWIQDDLSYTKALITYAKDFLGVNPKFEYHLANLFLSAVAQSIITKDSIYARTIADIFNTASSKTVFVIYVLLAGVRKIYNRLYAL